jgi:Putative transposase, YhgA-like
VGAHDALVKFAFSNVEHARGMLATALPPAVAARIDFATLRLVPGSFVDDALRDRHADLLFSARVAGRDTLLYLLLEHKSEPEPLTPLQLLRYMIRIWDQHLGALPPKERARIRKIPVIVPVVLHHDPGGWTAATTFEEILDADEAMLATLGEHVPRLRLVIEDLAERSDDDLHARTATAFARLTLWCLRNAWDAGWLEGELGRWKDLMRDVLAEPDGLKALGALFRYILRVNPAARPDVLRGLLPGDRAPEVEEAVMNWFDEQMDRGRKEARREGEREGLCKGQRGLLLKQLRVRFGEVPAGILARVDAADSAQLDVWAERFVTASSLDDVFGAA